MSSYLAGQPSSDGVQLTFLGTQQGPTTSTMTQHSSRNDSMQGDQLLRVYRATYSGVLVYEMEVGDVTLMHRVHDRWLNATHILKLANVPKARRVKILDSLIATSPKNEVEKVQGGYGKYQGTWIPFERGLAFAHEYHVQRLMQPLLDHDPNRTAIEGTPTKEQAVAAARQRKYAPAASRNGGASQDPNDTYVRRISSTAYQALNAINRAGIETRGPGAAHTHSNVAQSAGRARNSQTSSWVQPATASQQSTQSIASEAASESNLLVDSAYGTQAVPRPRRGPTPSGQAGLPEMERPRKRLRRELTQSHDTIRNVADPAVSTPTEANYSLVDGDPASERPEEAGEPRSTMLNPAPERSSNEIEVQRCILQSLFIPDRDHPQTPEQILTRLSGEDLDYAIDEKGNTALHWGASLGRTDIVRALIHRGANVLRLNRAGETALIRAAVTTNAYDDDTFGAILDLLGSSIPVRDHRRRTILHHIALESGKDGRQASSKSYLETLLGFVIRQPGQSAPTSQEASFASNGNGHRHANHDDQPSTEWQLAHANGPKAPPTECRPTSLGRFMSDIVNAEDYAGDTALNIAARLNSKNIVEQLLEIGADANMPNQAGLTPSAFGVSDLTDSLGTSGLGGSQSARANLMHRMVSERVRSILSPLENSMVDIQKDTYDDLLKRYTVRDEACAKLKETTAKLVRDRKRVEDLERRVADSGARKEQMALLQARIDDLRSQGFRTPKEIEASKRAATNDPYLQGQGPPHRYYASQGPSHLHNGEPSSMMIDDLGQTAMTTTTTITATGVWNIPQDPSQVDDSRSIHEIFPNDMPLEKRIAIIEAHNGRLERRLEELRDHRMLPVYQRIVALCTGLDVAHQSPDELERLNQGVASDGPALTGPAEGARLREVVRKIRRIEAQQKRT